MTVFFARGSQRGGKGIGIASESAIGSSLEPTDANYMQRSSSDNAVGKEISDFSNLYSVKMLQMSGSLFLSSA